MAGMGQFNITNRGNLGKPNVVPQPKAKKQGFFGEDEPDVDFFNQSMFRPDKEIPGFGPKLYGQSGLPSVNTSIGGMQQRVGLSAVSSFPRTGSQTPTSGIPSTMFPPPTSGSVSAGPISFPPSSIQSNFPINMPPQQVSPNRELTDNFRNLLSSIGGQNRLLSQIQNSQYSNLQKRNNPISAGLLNSTPGSITSMSTFGTRTTSSTDTNQASLDLSEFPTLGNRNIPPNPVPTHRNYGALGMVSQKVTEPVPEFHIQQEDFPALPGAQNPPNSMDLSNKTEGLFSQQTVTGPGSYEQALNKTGSSQSKRGIQTHTDGTVSNIPFGMVNDQFGMVGLLTFIRAAETDPNLVALAPGIDLTTLGLNLNSPDNLYSTFQSPWADSPCRPQDIDFHVPSEYLTNLFIKEKLAPIKLNRYGEDLLFFLFYLNAGDVLQLAAAAELYNRDWRYHKDERLWITRPPGMEPLMKTNTYERGTYYFFDAQNWRKVAKEFHLEYDKLEDRPHLPPTLHHNPNQNAN